jgi:zinc D-Ala-D-Ala carboxypeptidase
MTMTNTTQRKVIGRSLGLLIAGLAAFGASGVLASPAQATIIPGRCEYTNSQPALQRGSSGTAVRQLQCELNWAMTGDNLSIDGDFGPATERAVRRFQGCVGIGVDGEVGPITWPRVHSWAASSQYAC